MTLRNYSSTAVGTTLTAGVNNVTTTIPVAATTGFPSVPFILILDPDLVTEEVTLCTTVASLNLTVTRGYDGTTAVSHGINAKAQHSFAAIDFREPNTFLNNGGTVGGAVSVTGTMTATTFSGSGASLTNIPAGQLSGTIPSAVLGNSTVFIGTTGVALNRTTAALTLAGITLTTPTISDFTNANHTHAAAASGGTLSTYALVGQTMFIGTTGVAINRTTAALTLAGITLTTPTIADFTNATHTHAGATTGGTLSGYLSNPMTTLGDIIYGAAAGAATRLAGDTSNANRFLRSISSGGVAAAPSWQALVAGDIPSTLNATTFSGDITGTGNFVFTSGGAIRRSTATAGISIWGGISADSGASFELYGPSHATLANRVYMDADVITLRTADALGTWATFSGSSLALTVNTSTTGSLQATSLTLTETTDNNAEIAHNNNAMGIRISGGTVNAGAQIELWGGTHASLANRMYLDADQHFLRTVGGTTRLGIDTNGLITGSGTSLGAWTSFTVTVSGTGWTAGNGVSYGYYTQIGKTVHCRIVFAFGTTSTYGTGPSPLSLSLPFAARNVSNYFAFGQGYAIDASTGNYQPLIAEVTSAASTAQIFNQAAAVPIVTATSPFTWATSDQIRISCTYEVA